MAQSNLGTFRTCLCLTLPLIMFNHDLIDLTARLTAIHRTTIALNWSKGTSMIGYNVLNNGKCCPIVGIESDGPVKGSNSSIRTHRIYACKNNLRKSGLNRLNLKLEILFFMVIEWQFESFEAVTGPCFLGWISIVWWSLSKDVVYSAIKKGVRTISSSIRMDQECIGTQIQKGEVQSSFDINWRTYAA